MRPIHLTISNIGPFVGTARIDFEELGKEGLFLIHGRTGSGKTFLLDAMTYALFGEIPEGRDSRSLVSHHSELGSTPAVVFRFDAGGSRYEVVRQPIHERPKLRGTGTAEEKASVFLRQVADDGSTFDVPGSGKDHDAKIRHVVGLDATQFRRVILLPQGEFARFLRSNDRDREHILETLFDTDSYLKLSQYLKEQAGEAAAAVAEQEKQARSWGDQARNRWNEFVRGSTNGTPYTELPDDALDASAFGSLVNRVGVVVEETRTASDEATQDYEDANDAHTTAVGVAKLWDRRAKAADETNRLDAEADSITDARIRLGEHERARPVHPHAERLRKMTTERDRCSSDTDRILDELRRVAAGVIGLPHTFTALDLTVLPPAEMLQPLPVDLNTAHNDLDRLAKEAKEADGLEQEVRKQRVQAQKAAESATSLDQEREALTDEQAVKEAELERARALAGGLEAAQQRRTTARNMIAAHENLNRAREVLKAKALDADAATKESTRAHTEHDELKLRKLAGLSAAIASTLADGHPCPVCGSHEHPDPAQPADDDVTDDEITQAEARATEAKTLESEAIRARDKASGALGPLTDAIGDSTPDGAAADLARIDQEIESATQAGKAVQALNDRLSAIVERLRTLQDERAELGQAAATATARADDQESRARDLRSKVREAVGDDVDPSSAASALKVVMKAVDATIRHRNLLDAAERSLSESQSSLEQALSTAGFPDLAAAEAALLPEPEARALEERVRTHEESAAANRREHADLASQTIPDERPDTVASEQMVRRMKDQADAALKTHDRAENAAASIAELHDKYLGVETGLAGLRDNAAVLKKVSDRCNGQTGSKVSVQRWVLGRHLDEICDRANGRLATMTGGRYRLDRKDLRDVTRELAGLSLEVFDTYSDRRRDITTLSGGETFQASLALALGLAEVVQDRAGGRKLEALFVDEGFGTLDEETLHVCMNEIENLREGGRLVGLVSHVKEVKERIPYGIEVIKGRKGSRIRIGPTNTQ